MAQVWQKTVYTGETRKLSWDFDSDVPSGETISSPAIAVERRVDGTVSDVASGFTVSSESVSGTTVTFLLAIGDSVAEDDYGLEVQVTCSDGQTLHASSGGAQPELLVREM